MVGLEELTARLYAFSDDRDEPGPSRIHCGHQPGRSAAEYRDIKWFFLVFHRNPSTFSG